MADRSEGEGDDETGCKMGEMPGGMFTERIRRNRGRKWWIRSDRMDSLEDVESVEDLVDQLSECD